jgi:methionine-rich copper-binding protein CopC
MVRGKGIVSSVLALLLMSSAAASAHTSVVTTTPLYKSTVTSMPLQISIEFTDELMTIGDKEVNTISVTAPDKSEVTLTSITLDKNLITANLPDLEYQDGTYLVSYRVVSADGHPVSGSYPLYLNAPSPSASQPVTQEEGHGFFHIHQTHIIQAGVVLILIALWWGYRRFNREVGE